MKIPADATQIIFITDCHEELLFETVIKVCLFESHIIYLQI